MKIGAIYFLIAMMVIPITGYTQIDKIDFPVNFNLTGKSGYKERFAPDDYYEDNVQRNVVLSGVNDVDSLRTSIRRLTSSYDRLQYLVFDNYYYEDGKIKNEVNLQSIYTSFDRARTGDWSLVDRKRLSNGNILVIASIYHVSQSIIPYIYRFMIFDSKGSNLLSRNDYCLNEKPAIVQEINGGFSAVIGKDYEPILIDNYTSAGNAKIETFANIYRQSLPAVGIIRFDDEAKVLKKNSYLIHNDAKINKDRILDVSNDSKFNYVLLISNLTGVINQPTLSVLTVQRDRPSVFEVQNIVEPNAILSVDNSVLKKKYGKMFVYLPGPEKEVEIKNNLKTTTTETQPLKKPQAKETVDNPRQKGDDILAKNGINYQCRTLFETSYGTFIGARDNTNTPINYVLKDGKLSEMPQLRSYTVFDYNPDKDLFLIGYYDKSIKFADTMSRQFFLYNFNSNFMTEQVKYTSDVYRAQFTSKGDSVACSVNTKNANGIGSSVVRKATKTKAQRKLD